MSNEIKAVMSLNAVAEGIRAASSLNELTAPIVGAFATKSQYEDAIHQGLLKALEFCQSEGLEVIREAKFWPELAAGMRNADDKGRIATWLKEHSPIGLNFNKDGSFESVATRIKVRKKAAESAGVPVWDMKGAAMTRPWECEKESLKATAATDIAKATKAIAVALAKVGYETDMSETEILNLMDTIRQERLATAVRDYQSSGAYEDFTAKRTAAKVAAKRAG